jgi:hypothetical protein
VRQLASGILTGTFGEPGRDYGWGYELRDYPEHCVEAVAGIGEGRNKTARRDLNINKPMFML